MDVIGLVVLALKGRDLNPWHGQLREHGFDRVTGELVTASLGNTHWRDEFNELRPGGLAIASQAADDFILASSSTQLTRQGSADIKLWIEVFT